MTRSFSTRVGLVGFALSFSVLAAACGGEAPPSVETAPGAVLETVALTVEGMT